MSLTLVASNPNHTAWYSVRRDKKSWSKDKLKKSWLENRGFTVCDSRRGDSDKDLFLKDKLVAKLFVNRSDALRYRES